MTPADQWHQWRREGRPTLGSRKPLLTYLLDNAQWCAADDFVAEARGQETQHAEELLGTVGDLLALVRVRGVGLCNIAERFTMGVV